MQLLALLFASSITMMANTVIAPALPSIAEAFLGVDPQGLRVRMLLTAPAIVTMFAAPLAGFLGDRWKRIPLVLIGLILFAACGSAGLWLEELESLMVSRLCLGVAVGMLLSMTSSLIGDYYTGERRIKVMGYQGMANALGGVVFILLGGILGGLHWRAPFAVYLIGILLAIFAFLFLPEPSSAHAKHGSAPVPSIGKRKWSRLILLYLTALIGISCFFLIPVNVAFLLQERFGLVGAKVGFIMASSTMVSALVSWHFSRIRNRFGWKGTYLVTFVSMALAMWILSWASNLWVFMGGMVLNGIGLGCMFPNTTTSVLEIAPPALRGRFMGFLSSAFFLGQFLSPVFSGLVIAWRGALSQVFVAAAVVQLAMAIVYGALSWRASGISAGERS